MDSTSHSSEQSAFILCAPCSKRRLWHGVELALSYFGAHHVFGLANWAGGQRQHVPHGLESKLPRSINPGSL